MRALFVAIFALVVAACAADVDPTTGSSESLRAECNVLCIEGYRATPGCTCVPEGGRECTSTGICVEGYHWDATRCGCAPDAPEPCGDGHCPVGQVCCNDSCGICTEPGGYCIQVYCE